MTDKTAVYPGSFDPFTNGHLDVVERALGIFDSLIVAVAANPDKRRPLFTVEERVHLIEGALKGHDRVEVSSYTGLTVEYARSRGANTLVKGLRAYFYVSSSILKDIASYGGNVSDLVPPGVAKALKEKFR